MRFQFTRRQWSTIIVISIADFCNAICVALQAPFFPQEAENKGCTATEYGLVFGVFELVVFIISPFYGAHLNRLGPKVVFNAGILTTSTCAILFGFLDKVDGHVPFVTLAFAIRIVEALGNAAFLTASFAIIAKEFPNNVATMFASLETFFGLGLIAGPMIGGALYGIGGYSLPFAVLGATLFCTALLCYITLPKSSDDEDYKHSGPSMLTLLRVPGVLIASLSIISTSMSIGFLQATLEPHFRQVHFNFSPVVLGLIFVINGGFYAVSAPAWGWLCDHPAVKPKYITSIGHMFVVAAFLLIGPAPFFDMPTILWVTVLGLVLHGLGMGSLLVSSFSDALSTAISNGFPNSIETYGLVSGLWTSTFALGAFIGPTVSGVLFDSIGFRSSTAFIVILHIIVTLMVLVYMWTCDRSKMDLSVSAGDLLQMDGTLDKGVLTGEDFIPASRPKSRRYGISLERSRPPAMNSLIACSSYKNRRSPWSQRTPRYRPSYGSLDTRFRGTVSIT
ncbi:MFS-type transporter SLC18B1-like [Pieris brassicae]|uniref:Major facilitator superfamily (MFS) profile domain-containing protein n=1 Tax=Pieris brassicae TaxID=7116 RepID=A0A9P0SZL5_PIEBR|nr:MFS-type transporter SLC18B1-like [Pieris brassicae]CAH3980264.1 unnamed protein product [Pieris brassicae]